MVLDVSNLLAELRAQHRRISEEYRADLTRGGAVSPERRARWDEYTRELNGLEERIAVLRAKDEAEARTQEARGRHGIIGSTSQRELDEVSANLESFFRGDGRRAVEVSLRNLPQYNGESRVLSDAAAQGGALFGPDFVSRLYESQVFSARIRQTGVSVLTRDDGRPLLIPEVFTHPTGSIVSEGSALGTSDPVFSQGTITTYKYGELVQVTNELVEDSATDLLGYLSRAFGRAIGNASGADFVTGNGSSKPQGILAAGGTLVVTGGTGDSGAPVADDVISTYYKLTPPYRDRAVWFMSDSAAQAIRKLKASGTGQYLWSEGFNDAPDTLLGRPVITDPNMPATAVNATAIAFGDFSLGYLIGDMPIRFERSDDFAFDKDIVTFRCIQRSGGVPVDKNAIAYFKGGTA